MTLIKIFLPRSSLPQGYCRDFSFVSKDFDTQKVPDSEELSLNNSDEDSCDGDDSNNFDEFGGSKGPQGSLRPLFVGRASLLAQFRRSKVAWISTWFAHFYFHSTCPEWTSSGRPPCSATIWRRQNTTFLWWSLHCTLTESQSSKIWAWTEGEQRSASPSKQNVKAQPRWRETR